MGAGAGRRVIASPRRVLGLVLGAALLVALAVLPGVARLDGAATAGTEETRARARPEPTAPAALPEPPPDRVYGVGQRDLVLVDQTRPTQGDAARGLTEQPRRTIPTRVLYPTEGDPTATAQLDAPMAPARFPLVVFSHGLTANGGVYAPLVEPLVRQGYVIALPTFPLSSGPAGLQGDYVNQPADVSFVLDELLRLDGEGGWLAGHIDQERLVAAGHSLGAITTLGVVHNGCCIDPRIVAAIPIAGIPLTFPEGGYTWPDTPTLLVHGVRDFVVPVDGSDAVFDAAPGPIWYLRFTEADHFSVGLGQDGALTMEAIVAFLDAALYGRTEPLAAMARTIAISGRGEWRVKAG